MRNLNLLKILIFLQFLFAASLTAQNGDATKLVRDTLRINLKNQYTFSAVNVIPYTESIRLRNKTLDPSSYKIDYVKGSFSLNDSVKYSLTDTLFVTYRSLRLSLQKEYKRRSLVVQYDNQSFDTIKVVRSERSAFSSESIFGKGIEKSGSIVRGFSVGTNKDFSVSSGLRLQLSGKLSDEIDIVAALTDENTPIQPEGNTATLEELDKVFIEIRHPNAIGTFGDYDMKTSIGEFGVLERKLQGLKGEVIVDKNDAVVAIAGSRGKFNTNQFNGSDGNQGPYRLYGVNNENNIIIIAGSEHVYLDGEEMKRGENYDYTIEYSNAQITFTPKRLITSASRISVDFEYTDRRYQRNFYGAAYQTKLFDDRFNIGFTYFREGDDENSPIDISLSDEDKKILEAAGDDPLKAVKSGVTLATPDSLGKTIGIYTKVDTVISGSPYTYYRYAPGSALSIYNVSFSYVGAGKGDYNKASLGNYQFAGINAGSYAPVIFLPLPSLKQTGNLVLNAEPLKNLNVALELAGSLWDKNKFSSVDDGDNFGSARNFKLDLSPTDVQLGNMDLGKIGLNYRDRYIQKKYTSLDRINAVEFDRYYNVDSDTSDDETLREMGIKLLPVKQISLNGTYGYLKRGDNFVSDRYTGTLTLSEEKSYNGNFNLDYVTTKNNGINTNWMRQNGSAFYTIGSFKPGMDYLYENKKQNFASSDSLLSNSLQYDEIGPYLEMTDVAGFDLKFKYSFRNESFPLNGVMEKQSNAQAENVQMNYHGSQAFSSSLDLTFRNKKYTDEFKQQGLLDNQTILILSQSRLHLLQNFINGDLYYQVATERTAKLEKVFVRVPQGTGNYIYLGDLNNNGIAEENEFQLTAYEGDYVQITIPTDQLYPVIDLKTSTRWKLEFSKVFTSDNLISKILKPVSTETFWRIEENSKEPDTKKIYLLSFPHFLNDSTTISGSNLVQQDLYLWKYDNEFSLRFRYSQRRSLNQFSGGVERGYFSERGVRVKFQFVKEINNQTEFTMQNDNLISPSSTNRARTVSNTNLSTDFSYRPVQNIEVGFKIAAGSSRDNFPVKPTEVNLNSQTLRFTFSFSGLGRLRIETERDELTANETDNYIPFEITKGNVIGKNYFWRLNFDYRVSGNLQTTVSYDGRYQGSGRVIHTMRAEARAYF